MARSVEYVQADEIEGMTSTDLHEHVEKVQEDNWRLETLLEEARGYLEDLVNASDSEEIEEVITSVKAFLEQKLETESF